MNDAMSRLWAGWRIPYILADHDERSKGHIAGLTLFEGIEQSGLGDDTTYILWRGELCFALLNAYPYASTCELLVLDAFQLVQPVWGLDVRRLLVSRPSGTVG